MKINNTPLSKLSAYEQNILKIEEMNVEQINLLNFLLSNKVNNISLLKVKEIKYYGEALKLSNGRIIDVSYIENSDFEKAGYELYHQVEEMFHEDSYVLINEEDKTISPVDDYFKLSFDDA